MYDLKLFAVWLEVLEEAQQFVLQYLCQITDCMRIDYRKIGPVSTQYRQGEHNDN